MIDVKTTIMSSIKDRIKKMRFLAENNPKAMKKILYLIILDDVYEWSSFFDTSDSIKRQLKELRTTYIMKNPEFILERMAETYESTSGTEVIVPLQPYVNVNTPQTNDTWKRVWDAPEDDYFILEETIEPSDYECVAWEPDYTCVPQIVYYTNDLDEEGEKVYGKPVNIDINKLTTCEKMDVYINRDDNTAWYLEEGTCTWKQLNGSTGITSDQALALIKANRQGIVNTYADDTITHTLSETSTDTASMPVATDEEMEDLL